MKKRTLSLILALLMLATAVTACSETKEEQNGSETTPSAADESSSGAENEAEEENAAETTELQPDLPDVTFDDQTFTFLTSGQNDTNGVHWETYDIWVESTNGEVINDAVFDRNMYIEDKYKVKLAEFKASGATLDEIRKEVTSDSGAFDVGMTHFENSATLSKEGYLQDLNSIDYIDTTKPWWDQRLVEDLTIMDSLYIATGDITVIDNDATWVLMFNKAMVANYQMPNLYDLVREDKWYYDTFLELIEQGTEDTDGDGVQNFKNDQYGLITTPACAYGLLFASGEEAVVRDPEAILMPASDIERMTGVIDKAMGILANKDITVQADYSNLGSDDVRNMFEEGRGLFFGEVMQCIIRMRESDTDFGLIPWPKYDEGQDRYYNWIHSSAGRGVVVPANKTNLEFIGTIVEAMAAKSMYTLTPAYYDISLTYKFMRDAESAEMLDIILDSRLYDLSAIYGFGLTTTITNMINSGTNTFASKWKALSKSFGKSIEKTVETFTELKEERG